MVVRDTALLEHLPSALALYRSALAHMLGDADASIASARAAFEAAGPDKPLERGGAAGMLALAYWARGDLDDAHVAWSESAANLETAGHQADILGVSLALADIRIAQGRLDDARRTYERGLGIGEGAGRTALRGTVDMHVGLADLHRERNDLAAAQRHLDAAAELGEALGLPQNPYRQRVVAARLRAAEGDFDAAIALLDEADRRYDGDFFPNVRPVPAVRARVRVVQGRLADARDWARGAAVSAGDDLTYMREYEHATLARLLLAEGLHGKADGTILGAIELAERLVAAADAGGRNGSLIDVLVVLALARHARGERQVAAAALDRAVSLGEPEGYVRIFLDEGQPMTALLKTVGDAGRPPGYVRELLSAAGPAPRPMTVRQALIEPLSERELEVLRLLDSDLDGPEVARELSISLNTLRTHTQNVYTKLGVNSRRAALRRAVELGILPQTGGRASS
jgi:LuxR family maltose regulon positive regulatory protein